MIANDETLISKQRTICISVEFYSGLQLMAFVCLFYTAKSQFNKDCKYVGNELHSKIIRNFTDSSQLASKTCFPLLTISSHIIVCSFYQLQHTHRLSFFSFVWFVFAMTLLIILQKISTPISACSTMAMHAKKKNKLHEEHFLFDFWPTLCTLHNWS